MSVLNEKQKQAVGEVMADNFGSHIQSGWVQNSSTSLAYVCWKNNPADITHWAYIDEEGTVSYD